MRTKTLKGRKGMPSEKLPGLDKGGMSKESWDSPQKNGAYRAGPEEENPGSEVSGMVGEAFSSLRFLFSSLSNDGSTLSLWHPENT